VVAQWPQALDIGVLSMARKLRRTTLAMASCALAMMSWKPLFDPSPLIVLNASNSVPRGIYWIENRLPDIKEIAVLKLPEWVSVIADQRRYLPKNTWLLKPVAASEGTVCRFGVYVFLDGFPLAKALKQDKSGRSLPVWKGCKQLRENEVFVLSRHRDSFDSRYFGPVGTGLIIGTAESLITVGK
jgi:type IV secretory pathway protease TraF